MRSTPGQSTVGQPMTARRHSVFYEKYRNSCCMYSHDNLRTYVCTVIKNMIHSFTLHIQLEVRWMTECNPIGGLQLRTFVEAVLIGIILSRKRFQWLTFKITRVLFQTNGFPEPHPFACLVLHIFCSYASILNNGKLCKFCTMFLVYIHNMFLHDFCMCPVSYALL